MESSHYRVRWDPADFLVLPILCNRRDSARQERVCVRSRSGTRLHSRKDGHDRARLDTNPVSRCSRTQHVG